VWFYSRRGILVKEPHYKEWGYVPFDEGFTEEF